MCLTTNSLIAPIPVNFDLRGSLFNIQMMSPVSIFSNLKATCTIWGSIPCRGRYYSLLQNVVSCSLCAGSPFSCVQNWAGRQVDCSPPPTTKVKEWVAPCLSFVYVSLWHRQGQLYPYLTGKRFKKRKCHLCREEESEAHLKLKQTDRDAGNIFRIVKGCTEIKHKRTRV